MVRFKYSPSIEFVMAKIALVSDAAYPWNVGGVETLERVEAEALAKRHEVHFFSFRWRGMGSRFRDGGIMYHTFHEIGKEKFYRHGRRSIREALVFSAVVLRIFRYRFKAIQANQFPILHLPVLKLYCVLSGCKLIIDVHEVWDKEYWTTYVGSFMGTLANAYATMALRLGDRYIANSEVTALGLERLGVQKEKIDLFSPVIDDDIIRSTGNPKQKREVIFAGRLIKEKRLDKWLLVLKSMQSRTRARGVIIGEGPEEDNLASSIRRMGLSGRVELRRFYKSKQELYRRIRESALLLQMSEREGLSMIVLQSIALGTPVLLPDYSPIPDDIKRMCVVGEENELPRIAEKMMRGPKARYIKGAGLIDRFYISKAGNFYEGLFARMGVS